MTRLAEKMYMMLYEEESVRLLSRLVEMIHIMLYEEGARWPEKISTRWLARCHMTYHMHVTKLKDCPSNPPTNITFMNPCWKLW